MPHLVLSMKTNRPLTVISLLLSLSMAAMEMTVVSTAMPTVVGDLGGIHLYSWVFTGYLLTSTVSVPLFGKLADLYGRKPVLLAGIGVFLLGSIASGLAGGIGTLIAFRALQGLGAGAMQPTTLTIVGDIYNLEERSRMQGVFGAVWGVAGLIGPLLGGIIVKYLSWRWVFFINVPAGIAAAALLVGALHENVERRRHSLDWAGAGLLTVGLTALLIGVHGGRAALLGLPVAALSLLVFLVVERRAPEPVLPLDLFRQRVIGVATVAGALVGAGMISMVTYVPLYVQAILGGSPTEAGGSVASDAADRLLGPEHGAGLDPDVLRGLAASLQAGLGTVFWAIAGISIAAAVISLFFPHLPVGARSADASNIAQPAEMSTLPPEA